MPLQLVDHPLSLVDLNTVIGLITAMGVLLTGVGTFVNSNRIRDNKESIQDVHDKVKTSNGRTIGEIVEQELGE